VRLFIVARRFALLSEASLCCLLSFFLEGSLADKDEDREDEASRTDRYWEDFDLVGDAVSLRSSQLRDRHVPAHTHFCL
jgi:hypothetical protein